jgi:hypothetical protein
MSTTVQQTAAGTDDVAPTERNSEREWLSAKEVAKLFRVSERRVHLAVRAGELRAAILDSRGRIVCHRNWARTWIEQLADRGAPANQPGGQPSTVHDFKRAAAADGNGDGHR